MMLRRISIVLFATVLVPTEASTQTPAAPAPTATERFAIGVVMMPALDGGNPWLLPAIRLSMPLPKAWALDVDAGRVIGGVNRVRAIRTFYGARLRIVRQPRAADGSNRYWTIGLHFLPVHHHESQRLAARRSLSVPLAVARGWDQVFANSVRTSVEVGGGGGDGLMAFASLTVQWQCCTGR